MTVYAVGDLQGCLDPLKRLMEQVKFDTNTDTLWLTGDLVNRGPQSLACLRFVKELGDRAVTVLGNHDLHLLAIRYGEQKPKRKDTLQEILEAPDCEALMEWLVSRPLAFQDPESKRLLVHAGIPHIWKVERALEYAAEVESVLRDPVRRGAFFNEMYGNKPVVWSDKLKGMARLRVITNYLTRMRFVDAKAGMELETKSEPEKAPKGYKPWYQFPRKDEAQIVFGHWAALQGKTNKDRFVALDTGCIWGGCLTLWDMTHNQWYNTECTDLGQALEV